MFFEMSHFSGLSISENSDVSFIVIDSEFWNCQMNSDISSSIFFNCYFKGVKFKEFMSSNKFKFCGFKHVQFPEEGVSSTQFDGSQMSDVRFGGFTTRLSLKGIDATEDFSKENLWPKVQKKLSKEADLSGVDFPPLPYRSDDHDQTLTENDGYIAIKEYNEIIKEHGFLSNKEIGIPRDWEGEWLK